MDESQSSQPSDQVDQPTPLDEFMNALDALSPADLLALDAAWRGVSESKRQDAWTSVVAVAALHGLGDDLALVRDRVSRWATKSDNRTPLSHIVHDDIGLAHTRSAAAPALVDAAVAIFLGSYLDERTRDVLCGPWLVVTAPDAELEP